MKKLLLILLCLPIISFGQFTDNFSDGDFIANPAWLGNVGVFEVDTNNILHLNDSIAGVASLVTQSQAIINGEWIFDVRLDFSPSTSNYAKIYIASDMMDLSGPLNGVYVKIGGQSGSIDDISLYTQTGINSNEIIDGVDSLVSNNPDIRVKVTRDAIGNWELFLDTNGVFFTQGTAFDNSITFSDYFGVYCKYTFTRAKKMWFDNFSVSGGFISQLKTYVPDDNFENYLEANGMGDGIALNDSVTTANINSVTTLYVSNQGISDLTGIEDFTALTYLNCYFNQLASLNVSQNTALDSLYCPANQITSLDVSQNTALNSLNCTDNQLTSLDVSTNTALTTLSCRANQLTSLDVSNNTALTNLDCALNYPSLTSLDVSGATSLTTLDCYFNQITSLDVSTNIALITLYCDSNQLTILDVSQNTALTSLQCFNNQLTSLDVSQNTALYRLDCSYNQLTSLDVRNGNNTNFFGFGAATNPNLSCINADDSTWSTNNWTDIDPQHYFSNNCNFTKTYLPDDNFEQELINLGYDNFLDDSVITANINTVTTLNVSNPAFLLSISDLTGIEDFTALTYLNCEGNQLTSLDVSQNTALTVLNCSTNVLTSLDVSQNTALEYLECGFNQLISLNVSGTTALTYLSCWENQLTSLDLSTNTALTSLDCWQNELTSLDLRNGNNTALYIYTQNNPNLFCIDVDVPVWSATNWTGIDAWASFSSNCGWLPAENLFFSEYAEGSSSNKYFEIYNPTSDTVDLTNYAFARVTNSPTTVGVYEYWVDFDSAAIILPNDVYVVAHPSSDLLILAEADMNYGSLSNGDDGFALVYGNNPGSPMSPSAGGYQVLDWIGDWNGDPGSGWDVAGENNATEDHTLIRKCDVIQGDTSWTNSAGTNPVNSQWIVLANDDWSDIGQHIIFPCNLIYGCMDSLAANYNPLATIDDSSCVYCNLTVSYSATNVSCFGMCDGSADVSVSGGTPPYSYSCNGQITPAITNLCADTYTCIVIDANGCIDTITITIMGPDALSISVASTDETSALNDGSATASVVGGTPAYTYTWSNGGTTNSQVNLAPGLYTVDVTDANGCEISDATSVNAYTPVGVINIKDTSKTLIKVTDVLGRETKGTKNEPLFYIYDDGTVEKRIIIE